MIIHLCHESFRKQAHLQLSSLTSAEQFRQLIQYVILTQPFPHIILFVEVCHKISAARHKSTYAEVSLVTHFLHNFIVWLQYSQQASSSSLFFFLEEIKLQTRKSKSHLFNHAANKTMTTQKQRKKEKKRRSGVMLSVCGKPIFPHRFS